MEEHISTRLYITSLPETISPQTLVRMFNLVSPGRAEKSRRFRQVADQYRSLTGEILLHKVLGEQYGLEAPEIEVGVYGKPHFSCETVHFNISHAGNYIALVTGDSSVGVDVEVSRTVSNGLEEVVFTDEERQWIKQSKDCQNAFFRLWTLKESYIKALGLGLQKPLKEFSFSFNGGRIQVCDESDNGAESPYNFAQGVLDGAYWALCSGESLEGLVPSLIPFDELV